MPDLTRAVGEPITIKLEGREFTLSPITIGDLAAFEKHVKEERLENFLAAAGKAGMNKEERIEGITRLLTVPFTADDFAAALGTISGVQFLIWRSIRRKHPKFKMDQVSQLSNLEDLMAVVNSISNVGRVTEAPPAESQASE